MEPTRERDIDLDPFLAARHKERDPTDPYESDW